MSRPTPQISNLDDLVARYVSGEGLQSLAQENGIADAVLKRRFIAAGVPIRDRRAASRMRFSNMDATARASLTANAIARRRGFVDTDETRRRRAETAYYRQLLKSPIEDRVSAFLRIAGFDVVQQFPLEGYNLDIALDGLPVAVEIERCSGTDFATRRVWKQTRLERLEQILDRGWTVLYVIAAGHAANRQIDLTIVGDQLIRYLQLARRDDSTRGKYRVIWGRGQPPARARYDFGHLTSIE